MTQKVCIIHNSTLAIPKYIFPMFLNVLSASDVETSDLKSKVGKGGPPARVWVAKYTSVSMNIGFSSLYFN